MSQGKLDSAAAQAITDRLRETPRLSVERLPVLTLLFERLATACGEALREYCAAPVTAFVNQIEVRESWDLLEAFEDSIAVVFYSAEWDARVLIGLERRLVWSLLETMFGGDGSEAASDAKRAFTLLETRIGRAVCEEAARAFQIAFAQVCQISLKAETTETRLEFTTLGQSSITMLSAQILLEVQDNGGRMFVFVPQAALYPMRHRLERERAANPAAADPWWAKKMQTGISHTEVTVDAVIEGKDLRLADIRDLRPGQIVSLKGTDRTVFLECGGQRLSKGRLGQSDGFFSVTVDTVLADNDELLDDILFGAAMLPQQV